MAYEREHRVDDRELDRIPEEIARSDSEFDVPGKQTRAELVHRVTAMVAAEASRRPNGNPGKHAVSAPNLSFHDFQALALRDVLSRLGDRQELRVATLAASDPRVAKRVAERASGDPYVPDLTRASRAGRGLWQAAERRAVTLYRRANDAGVVSTRSSEVDAALAAIGSGTALPRDVCQMMEPIFGVRLDRVRIHSDSVAQRACDAVNADAFTVGEDIFLPRWDPRSSACRELLAHELVHCVQWWQGRIGPSAGRSVSRPSDALEQEADRFVRGINFERLDRRERTAPLGRIQRHNNLQLPNLNATVVSSPVAPALNALRTPVAQEVPMAVIPVAHAPNTLGLSRMLMRSANKNGDDLGPYGVHGDGKETWDSPNWQYWKDLAASMWLPPIGEVLKKDARLLADNVWLVFGGITLTMGLAYVAIVATGIVGAAAAIATWLAVWGMPAWATKKVVSDWLEQVERVKGNEDQAKIAKEKFAQVVVTLALFLARMKAPKQTTATSAAGQAERSGAAAQKQLETHVPAGNADNAVRQLPARNVPARSEQVPARSKQAPAKRGSNIRTQLPAIGATPSFIGPPTEQQFLDQHPIVFGSPEPGEFDGTEQPLGSESERKQLVVKNKAGNNVGIWLDTTKPNRVTIYESDPTSQSKVIGYINFEITNIDLEDTLEVKYIYRDPEFRDSRIGDLLFETMVRDNRLPQIYSRLSERNLHWFYQALTDHFRSRLGLSNSELLEDADQFLARGISASELQEVALKALEKTRAYQSQFRLGYRMVPEASGLRWTKQDRLERVPTMVFRQSEAASTQPVLSSARDSSASTVGPRMGHELPPSREQQYLNKQPMMGGSPEAGGLGQPSPDTDAVKARIWNAKKVLWIFDWDGTLADFNEDPAACAPTPVVLDFLQEIDSNPKYEGAIVSGRSYKDLDKWFGKFSFTLIGDHGASTREAKAGGKWTTEGVPDWIVQAKQIMSKEQYKLPEAFIEKKDFSVPWHYRAVVDQEAAKRVADALYNELRLRFADKGLLVQHDEFVIEVRDENVNKGTAASRLFRPGQLIYFAGDALTDESLHDAVLKYSNGRPSVTVKVGGAPSVAEYRVKNVHEHIDFLKKVIGR